MSGEVIEQGFKCTQCERIFGPDENDFEPSYECGNCGTVFVLSGSYDGVSHRCPDCARFSAKLYERTCPDCQDAEIEDVNVVLNEYNEGSEEWIEAPDQAAETVTDPVADNGKKKVCRVCEGSGYFLVPGKDGDTRQNCPNGCKPKKTEA